MDDKRCAGRCARSPRDTGRRPASLLHEVHPTELVVNREGHLRSDATVDSVSASLCHLRSCTTVPQLLVVVIVTNPMIFIAKFHQ